MKIAIDVTPLETGHAGRGIGVYTQLLIDALQSYEKEHTYTLFTRGQNEPKNIDLVHYPYFDPFFLTLPLHKPKPTVVTVHDLIPLVFPDEFPAGLRGNVKWQIQKLSLRGALRIISDSESSKKDIVSITDINAQKIDVVYLAPSDVFKPIKNKTNLDVVKKKYHLPNQFILYVGDVNWNKNILGMLKAFQKVKCGNQEIIRNVKLVLVGKAFLDASLQETQQINSFIDTVGLNKEVMMIGSVPMDDLAAIYNLASVYIQPSFYEGFGLPVLEAMACGCPVVTSDTSSLAEIAGPAILINPNNIDSIPKGTAKALLLSNIERNQLIQKQFRWVERFTWERVARETVRVYAKVLAKKDDRA